MFDPISLALGGATLLGGLFGEDEGNQASPTGVGGAQSGFQALPPEVQQAFLQRYLPHVLQNFNDKYQSSPIGEAPTGPFASLGLQELQKYSNENGGIFRGGTGVNPLGFTEPLNQFQQGALGSFGGGLSGFQQELPNYMNVYNQNVLEPTLQDIQRQHDILQNNTLGSKTGNLGAFGSSALGTQLAQLQDNANRLSLDARRGAFQGANNLRNQTLQQMLNAGNQVQQQGQTQLNALQPQLQQTIPQNMLDKFASQLNAIPGSTIEQGKTPSQPDFLSKIGNAGKTGIGLLQHFGGSGGGTGYNGIPFGQSLGNAMPWL